MAAAVTVIELTLAIGEIVKVLYEYTAAARDAKDDIRKLAQELFALKGALEHFDLHARPGGDDDGDDDDADAAHDQVRDMLLMTKETLDGIQARLAKHQRGLRGAAQSLTWPFRKPEIEKHLAGVERAKTWFIMIILQDASDTTFAVYDEMRKLAGVVHEDILQRRTTEMARDTDELLAWLAPAKTEELLAQATKNKSPGTGQWILDAEFARWLDPDDSRPPITWITGKSGSGKTVLFSSVIDQVRLVCQEPETPDRICGYHCCSLDNAASQQIPNIFGSVLAQIGRARPDMLEFVKPYKKSGSSTLVPQNSLDIAAIESILGDIVPSLNCLYIMVDALNEMTQNRELVTTLLGLCKQYPKIRVLVTYTTSWVDSPLVRERKMTTRAVDHDIELYVHHRLNADPGLRALSPNIQAEIRNKIVSDADGMFRWASLCMDRLARLRTGRDVRDALADMPTTLNDTYARLLDRIPAHDRPLAREALLWLCFSLRPLALAELAEAVVLRPSDTSVDDDCRLTNPQLLLDLCLGLVVWTRPRDTVTLAHDSVRSFLLSPHVRDSPAADFALDPHHAHAAIMRKCLAYLRLDAFAAGPVPDRARFSARRAAHPLLAYATTCWPLHSERFPPSPADESLVLAFFDTKRQPGGSSFESWVQQLLGTLSLHTIRQTEPLYYAASFGMLSVLRLLLRPGLGVDLDRPGGRFGSPPLFVAVWRRNTEAARLLIEAGADVDARDGPGLDMVYTYRSLAQAWGYRDIVRMMEDKESRDRQRAEEIEGKPEGELDETDRTLLRRLAALKS